MPEKEKESRFFKVKEKEEKEKEAGTGPKASPKKGKDSDLEQRIYQVEGILKTLDQKLESGEINEEEHEKKSENMRQELADLYEKKIKRELVS